MPSILFRRWEGRLPLVMRQSHAGGEKLFLDYAGDTVPVVVDRRTGEVRGAHIFVAVMGGSCLSFALATWTEQFPDWIGGNNAAFAFFRGVPQLLVPDNAKVAVIKACHCDPQVNRSYTDIARHYGTAILPTRPGLPVMLGHIGLERRFGAQRLEAAALRALEIQTRNYPSVKSILEKGLDQVPVPQSPEQEPIIHSNIRG